MTPKLVQSITTIRSYKKDNLLLHVLQAGVRYQVSFQIFLLSVDQNHHHKQKRKRKSDEVNFCIFRN